MIELLWAAIIGLGVGFLGGYAGIAGAPILVFLLTSLLGYSQHAAQGTTLAMMLGPMSLLAIIQSWEIIKPHLWKVAVCSSAYAITSYLGGLVAYLLTSISLQIMFGCLLICIGILYASQWTEKHVQSRTLLKFTLLNMAVAGAGIGLVGGLFGIGAGILLVPLLTSAFGQSQNLARMMSLAILLPPVSLGAVIKYGWIENDVNWPVAGVLLVSYMIFNGVGASTGHKHQPETLKRVLGILLAISGIILISQIV